MFSPPSVDKVSRERRVYQVRRDRPLPWESGHELQRIRLNRDQAWRHIVYVGIYPLDSVFDVLSQVFAVDGESYEERPAGESALAAFVVSQTGRPLIGSEVLSSCAWATGRTLDPGPDSPEWLSGFDSARTKFSLAFEDLMTLDIDDPEAESLPLGSHRPIGMDELRACHELAAALTATGVSLPHAEIRIKSVIVAKRKAYETDGHDFLNSFIADDLDKVAAQAVTGSIGAALREYLRPNSALDLGRRVDVRKDLGAVLARTAPAEVPSGRWPTDPSAPLALGQQLAVNSALRLGPSGDAIFAVNGPPGTGKTTMLRDLIAAIVVERAVRLAELAAPADAFAGIAEQWKTKNYTRTLHHWQPQFTGFEIVLASANNGAVENVTNEIPAHNAIDDCWVKMAKELNYFPDIAAALLAVDESPDDEPFVGGARAPRPTNRRTNVNEQQLTESTTNGQAEDGVENSDSAPAAAWGLMAARLGNKTNRSRFVDAFWYRKPDTVEGREIGQPPTNQRAQLGLRLILKEFELAAPPYSWADETRRFRAAAARVSALRAERQRACDALSRNVALVEELQSQQTLLVAARRQAQTTRDRTSAAEREVWLRQEIRQRHFELRLNHQRCKPAVFERMTSLGARTREWRVRDDELGANLATAEKALEAAHDVLRKSTREAEAARQQTRGREDTVRRCEAELAAARREIEWAQNQLGHQLPDEAWLRDRERRERAALWTDPEWNEARSELFLAALRLHKAFLQHVPTQMRQSLHAAVDVVSGEAPKELSAESALLAWQTLFFVVPVVSTTFASFGRLFEQLGKEALGWLLIDEAGQATPQNAVGALWRAQRAVIVGDPLQLEPVTTLPFTADQAIRLSHGVDEGWLSSRTSVQRLADRLTPLGTELPADNGMIWVGSPLTVHRRCDEPMFGVANTIAYDGLMINGTKAAHAVKFQERYPNLPATKWIDIVSEASEGHWVPAEGRQLDIILRALSELNFDMSEVMAIGPFRDIARRLKERAEQYQGMVAGTIHTAQGKQADIVILVLGSDPQRDGARRWAASKPNLLNVAVSRAKRRLYVIGDRSAWSSKQHFAVLAHRLPHSPPRSVN